jgi:hypothetical protein
MAEANTKIFAAKAHSYVVVISSCLIRAERARVLLLADTIREIDERYPEAEEKRWGISGKQRQARDSERYNAVAAKCGLDDAILTAIDCFIGASNASVAVKRISERVARDYKSNKMPGVKGATQARLDAAQARTHMEKAHTLAIQAFGAIRYVLPDLDDRYQPQPLQDSTLEEDTMILDPDEPLAVEE